MIFGRKIFERLDSLEENLRQGFTQSVNRHDDAIEDMLEEWEEFCGQTRENLEAVSEEVLSMKDEKIHTLEHARETLLRLCEDYQSLLLTLSRAAKEDPAWERQLTLMDESLASGRLQAGLSFIGKPGEPVDLNLHEILDVQKTENPEQNGTIREIYEYGSLYLGTVRKKARVSVWKY